MGIGHRVAGAFQPVADMFGLPEIGVGRMLKHVEIRLALTLEKPTGNSRNMFTQQPSQLHLITLHRRELVADDRLKCVWRQRILTMD